MGEVNVQNVQNVQKVSFKRGGPTHWRPASEQKLAKGNSRVCVHSGTSCVDMRPYFLCSPGLCDKSSMLPSGTRKDRPSYLVVAGTSVVFRDYDIKEMSQVCADVNEIEMQRLHQNPQAACTAQKAKSSTGGWCHETATQTLISKDTRAVDHNNTISLTRASQKAICKLLFKDGEFVADLGAGVGQTGHALRAVLPGGNSESPRSQPQRCAIELCSPRAELPLAGVPPQDFSTSRPRV